MHSRRHRHPACRQYPCLDRQLRGFSLLELIYSLTIGMILLLSGVPALQGLIQRNLHSAHVNTFVTHLHFSRSEAIKRRTDIVMCRGDNGGCKRTEGWHSGWLVFADNNENRELDNDETILKQVQGWDDGIKVTSGRRRRVVYQPTGFSPGTNGTYIFCNPHYPELVRAVILSNPGRPRLSKTRPDGSPLPCE